MIIRQSTYYLLLFTLSFSIKLFAITEPYQTEQEIDSLLKANTNRVYENPDQTIAFGLSVFDNDKYSIRSRTRALMLVSLGYTSKRNYQKALEYIEKANELSSNLKDQVLQVEILFRTGILYQQLKIYDKSIEFLEKTERLALTYPKHDSVGRFLANSYVVKGFIYKDNLNCDIALEFFNRGIREYEKIKNSNNNANLSIVYYNIGNCYILLSEYDNAKNSFSKSIKFAKLENANSLISFAKKGLAEVYTLESQYDLAKAQLLDALNQSKEVGDLILNLGIYKGLFENYLALNEWDNYQKYYDLYSKTQLDIKKSERSSVSDSIDKTIELQTVQLQEFENAFKGRLKWFFLIVFLMLAATFLIERKNKKAIKSLQKEVETLQKSNSTS
ncbi:tetratricopeptide repeat protein [Hanstruepera ponticola]|uniref:tetratricopeptide repeat protein n=1 Tax=Hanstruepera ponticola TaxID=2042995 RepID=UPI000CF0FD62|nr:tetratricopeptide repeat protein [Hanstruepera ponticola]